MSSSDFNTDFGALGLAPTESWSKVRAAYKRLARKWHPDRYTESGTEKREAEEKLKDINLAYTRLSNYYKKHGRLPYKKEVRSPLASEDNKDNKKSQTNKDHIRQKTKKEPDWSDSYAHKPEEASRQKKSGKLIFFIVVVTALFISLQDFDTDPAIQGKINTVTNEKRSAKSSVKIPSPPKIIKYFTYGSTLGKVHSVQGNPTKVEGDIWYYGKSEVQFDKGRVVGWYVDPDTPLNASATEIKNKIVFGVGSTANDVLQAQGRPSHMRRNMWEYGLSKIYFENGLVVRWYSSQSAPLNVTE